MALFAANRLATAALGASGRVQISRAFSRAHVRPGAGGKKTTMPQVEVDDPSVAQKLGSIQMNFVKKVINHLTPIALFTFVFVTVRPVFRPSKRTPSAPSGTSSSGAATSAWPASASPSSCPSTRTPSSPSSRRPSSTILTCPTPWRPRIRGRISRTSVCYPCNVKKSYRTDLCGFSGDLV